VGWEEAVREQDGELLVEVRARPGSKREGLEVDGDVVVVRVRAPPVDGKANARIVVVVAAALGLKRRQVHLVRGESSRTKVLAVAGISRPDLIRALSG
jgi:uncharacterized protein (TIGR00251 family)